MVAGILAFGGCDKVFGLKNLPPLDASVAPPIDALLCAPQIVHDDFTGSATCDDWGNPTDPTDSTATEGGGMLLVQPVANMGSQGGCISRAPVELTAVGLFLKVPQLLDPNRESNGMGGTFVFFRTIALATGDEVLTISANSSQINVADSTSGTLSNTPYDPVAMLWWRIRPFAGAVVAEVSHDGLAWQTLATGTGTVPASVRVEFTAGEYGGGIADPGMAIFEDFNICP